MLYTVLGVREAQIDTVLYTMWGSERVKYVGNDVYIWEMAQVFEKRLNYVGNDLDLWEMAQICGEMT